MKEMKGGNVDNKMKLNEMKKLLSQMISEYKTHLKFKALIQLILTFSPCPIKNGFLFRLEQLFRQRNLWRLSWSGLFTYCYSKLVVLVQEIAIVL